MTDLTLLARIGGRRMPTSACPKRASLSPACSGDLVLVGSSELGVGDLEYRAAHATIGSAVELHDRVMRVAAGSHDLRIPILTKDCSNPRSSSFCPLEEPAE